MEFCVACGFSSTGELVPMEVEGYVYRFCLHHTHQLGPGTPRTTRELAQRLGRIALERRTGRDRRCAPDRRVFPPRPEGRRRNGGRRLEDPDYA
jgi:hypothetical protein